MVANRRLQRGNAATHNRKSVGRRVARCCTIGTKGRCCRHNCRRRCLADACNAKACRRTCRRFIQCHRAVARRIGQNRTIIGKADVRADIHRLAVAGSIAITIGDRRRRGQCDRAVEQCCKLVIIRTIGFTRKRMVDLAVLGQRHHTGTADSNREDHRCSSCAGRCCRRGRADNDIADLEQVDCHAVAGEAGGTTRCVQYKGQRRCNCTIRTSSRRQAKHTAKIGSTGRHIFRRRNAIGFRILRNQHDTCIFTLGDIERGDIVHHCDVERSGGGVGLAVGNLKSHAVQSDRIFAAARDMLDGLRKRGRIAVRHIARIGAKHSAGNFDPDDFGTATASDKRATFQRENNVDAVERFQLAIERASIDEFDRSEQVSRYVGTEIDHGRARGSGAFGRICFARARLQRRGIDIGIRQAVFIDGQIGNAQDVWHRVLK